MRPQRNAAENNKTQINVVLSDRKRTNFNAVTHTLFSCAFVTLCYMSHCNDNIHCSLGVVNTLFTHHAAASVSVQSVEETVLCICITLQSGKYHLIHSIACSNVPDVDWFASARPP